MITILICLTLAAALVGLWPYVQNMLWWFASEQLKKIHQIDLIEREMAMKGLKIPCPVGLMDLGTANGKYIKWYDGTALIALNTNILSDKVQVLYTLLHERQHALGDTDEIKCEIAAYALIRSFWPDYSVRAKELFEHQIAYYKQGVLS
jgi:hypothetical protein